MNAFSSYNEEPMPVANTVDNVAPVDKSKTDLINEKFDLQMNHIN